MVVIRSVSDACDQIWIDQRRDKRNLGMDYNL